MAPAKKEGVASMSKYGLDSPSVRATATSATMTPEIAYSSPRLSEWRIRRGVNCIAAAYTPTRDAAVTTSGVRPSATPDMSKPIPAAVQSRTESMRSRRSCHGWVDGAEVTMTPQGTVAR